MPDFSTLAGGATETGSTPGSSTGITLTANAVANTKGAWAQVIASTLYPTAWLLISVAASSGGTRGFLLDIGIGASTAEKVLIADLNVDSRSNIAPSYASWIVPIAVPAGTRISARVACSSASSTLNVAVTCIAAALASDSGCVRSETLGAVSASTRGTQVDPGGVAHTDSAWGIGAATSFPWRWMAVSLAHSTTVTANASWLCDIGVGAAGSEKVLISDLYTQAGSSTDAPTPSVFCFPCSVPAGATLSFRARSDNITAADRVINATLTGFG